MNYYTSVLIISWLALIVLSVLVHENDRLMKKDKIILYSTYAIVALSALAEWLGIYFSGNTAVPLWVLKAVKCADYILTPIAGGALAAQLRSRSIWQKSIQIVIDVNVVFQLVSVFTGWMTVFDAQNRYSHGPLYAVYACIYFILTALIIIEFATYGRKFRRQNRTSLYATLMLVVIGIVMQEGLGGEIRTAYLALTLGMAMMFIHTTEFSQLTADDYMREQRLQIMLSQIQPHFLYNTLGAIGHLCKNVPEAKSAINKFSQYLRGNLNSLSQLEPIPFSAELEHTKAYLELEQLRFGDDLKVIYDLEVTDFLIPVLTLQPLVENAVRHGIRGNENGRGTVTITSREYDDCYKITVTDDGPGFDLDAPLDEKRGGKHHIGISNVQERLQYVNGGKLDVETAIGQGCRVTIVLPKEPGKC